jgi:hypothetical protein
MTAELRAAVLTARRATQHIRLFEPNDAYEHLCILTLLPEPSPVSALCWQIHRRLAVLVPLLRVWVHCPRASNGLLPRRSNLVGYVQWDAQFDPILLCQTIMSSSFSGRSLIWFFLTFGAAGSHETSAAIGLVRVRSRLDHTSGA